MRGVLGAHGQVADQDVGPGVLERLDDVDGSVVALVDGLAVVLAEAVERVAALHVDAQRRDVGDLDGVVLAGDDGLGQVATDLLGVDVERGDELDVADVVAAEVDVHEPRDGVGRVGVAVVLDALDERRGAVADADDGYADGTHGLLSAVRGAGTGGGQDCGAGAAGGMSRRSDSISSVSHRTSRSTDSSPCSCSWRV